MKDLVWIVAEAGTSLFEVILFFIFFNGFLTKRDTPRIREILVLVIAFAMQFVVGTWFYDEQLIMLISSTLVAVFICFSLYSGSLMTRLFSPLLVVAFMVALELISTILAVSAYDIELHDVNSNPWVKLIIIFAKNLLGLIAVKTVTYFRRSFSGSIKTSYQLMILVVPAISLVLIYVILDLIMHPGKEDVSLPVTGLLCLLYVNVMIFTVFEGFMRQVNKEYRYMLMEKQLDLQLDHYKQLAESRSRIQEIWHDFRNHVQCIRILNDKGDMESLGEYIRNLSCYEERANVLDTGNPVIDALLSNKQSIARQMGIRFEMELVIPPRLEIPPADICAILGNSLDNAIEACNRIKNPGIEKMIRLNLTYKNGYLVMELVNTFEIAPQRQGKHFKTWKSSPQFHGLGLQSIERTVEQNGGNVKIDMENGTFSIKILIPADIPGKDAED
ncbi:MAG: GHKL domain-containing protein [Clostridiaceae bacterium]|jgi:sensor histidine kinase YesM|nr:GHKL domain-containing protein [Clostridiaceae bacterium]